VARVAARAREEDEKYFAMSLAMTGVLGSLSACDLFVASAV